MLTQPLPPSIFLQFLSTVDPVSSKGKEFSFVSAPDSRQTSDRGDIIVNVDSDGLIVERIR